MTDDIVTRLRRWIDNDSPWLNQLDDDLAAGADEIERLRVAGDALHAAVRNHDLTEAHLRAWEEARRG